MKINIYSSHITYIRKNCRSRSQLGVRSVDAYLTLLVFGGGGGENHPRIPLYDRPCTQRSNECDNPVQVVHKKYTRVSETKSLKLSDHPGTHPVRIRECDINNDDNNSNKDEQTGVVWRRRERKDDWTTSKGCVRPAGRRRVGAGWKTAVAFFCFA